MSSPTIPNVPFPPLINTVATVFKDWQKHLLTKPDHYVNVVAFKTIMFAHRETVFAYGYLITSGANDTITGEARIEDEDHTFNPEVGWQGGDSFGPQNLKKVSVTAKLATVNGHPEISFDFGFPNAASLSGVSGKDPSLASAQVLNGDRTGTTGGKVLATFSKENFEKTHWPPS